MSEIKYEQQAFPTMSVWDEEKKERVAIFAGMTLRDYFVGKAILIVPTIAKDVYQNESSWCPEDYAKEAYKIADAMLKERERRHE